jgi:hypothetical protein
MNNNLLLGIFSAIILLRLSLFIHKKTEGFDPLYPDTKDIYIKSVEGLNTNPTQISNGAIQKYKNDDEYLYILNFNLPSVGSAFQTDNLDVPFNVTKPVEKYRVLAGNSMKFVGNLERQMSGVHYLEFNSKEDYKVIRVYLGTSLVSSVLI